MAHIYKPNSFLLTWSVNQNVCTEYLSCAGPLFTPLNSHCSFKCSWHGFSVLLARCRKCCCSMFQPHMVLHTVNSVNYLKRCEVNRHFSSFVFVFYSLFWLHNVLYWGQWGMTACHSPCYKGLFLSDAKVSQCVFMRCNCVGKKLN